MRRRVPPELGVGTTLRLLAMEGQAHEKQVALIENYTLPLSLLRLCSGWERVFYRNKGEYKVVCIRVPRTPHNKTLKEACGV